LGLEQLQTVELSCIDFSQEECARVLLFRGADKTLRNKSVQDAFQTAHSAGHNGIADIIRGFTANEVGRYYSLHEPSSIWRIKLNRIGPLEASLAARRPRNR